MEHVGANATACGPVYACVTRLDKAVVRAQFAATIAAVRAAGERPGQGLSGGAASAWGSGRGEGPSPWLGVLGAAD